MRGALRRWLGVSIRRRLFWLACAPLLLMLVALVGLTAYWTSAYSDRQLYMKVRSDLAVAQRVLDGLVAQQHARLAELARSQALSASLNGTGSLTPDALLEETRNANRLDWLRAIDPAALDAQLGQSLAQRLRGGETLQGLAVLSPEQLGAIDPTLPNRARLALRPTPHAAPTGRQVERRGLALRALYPLFGDQGELRLVLDAGRLLNGDPRPVDEIRDLIYGPGTLPENSVGTVTLFLGDVRISTNVPLPNGERALGTRVSQQVSRQVLDHGEPYFDLAFVVSDWYIAAYGPLENIEGERIGMIYAGFPEAPFSRLYRDILLQIVVMLVLVTLLSGLLLLRGVDRLAAPIRRMHGVIDGVRGGARLRIGELGSEDEVAELAREFDAMLDRLEAHQDELERGAEQLERRVDERTHSLTEKTRALQEHVALLRQARTRLLTQEKLATLGELTAGIAHEINNPAAVILGHIELIEQQLGKDGAPVREEIDTIIAQVERIRALIGNLLQYSRPGHPQPEWQSEDINEVVTSTQVLVRHALDKHGQRLMTQLAAGQRVDCHRSQLQQVLVNLILNAAQAGSRGQTIAIATRDVAHHGENGVEIDVIDQGPGIPDAMRERIFDPFFTTREAGSGLGLAISAGIVRRSGGEISVVSALGEGATFRVWLPCHARPSGADEDTTRKLLAKLSDVAQTSNRHTPE